MKFSTTKILTAAVLLAAGTQQAFATAPTASGPTAGTGANTTIHNQASVTYSVGGVVQTAPATSNDATFVVDRLINVTVTSEGNTDVTPGATGVALPFTVTNNTNDTMDYILSAANVASGDDFDASLGSVKYYLDSDDDGAFNSANDTEITGGKLNDMAPNAVVRVFVVADIPNPAPPNNLVNTNAAQVTLKATASDDDGATATTETAGADTAGMDTVFGDLAGVSGVDAAKDGAHSAVGSYVVNSATITVNKSSFVYSDPINNTTNPKAIPGAVMVYCIAVSNGSASVDATSVTVTDDVPVGTTYDPSTIRVINGAVTCDATVLTKGDAMTDSTADTETLSPTATPAANPAGTKGGNNVGGGAGGRDQITTVTDLGHGVTTTTVFEVKID